MKKLPENEESKRLVNEMLLGNINLKDNPFWLGNEGEAGRINQGLIKGGTLSDLREYSGSSSNSRVSSQISHLKKRGLLISKTKNKGRIIYKFEYQSPYLNSKKNVSKNNESLNTSSEIKRLMIFEEGKANEVLITKYERDLSARRQCVEHYGFSCSVCHFDFEQTYGKLGEGYIHVHHLKPISKTGVYNVNPIRDLRPVCPNCHAMLHRGKELISIEELEEIIKQNKNEK